MWRLRKSVKKRIVFCIVCVVAQVLGLVLCGTTVKHVLSKKYKAVLEEKNKAMEAAERFVYVTGTEVKAGECFSEQNVERKYMLCEQNPDFLVTDAIGLIACADLPAGVILNTALCCQQNFEETERECVFREIAYVENFSDADTVDVRIRYANGENYCVIAKKKLKKNEGEEICRFHLTEDEQLLISSACYDTEIYEGATLYLVGYREARLQEDTVSRYVPSIQVLTQLRDRNEIYRERFARCCEQRNALEERLLLQKEQQRNGVW